MLSLANGLSNALFYLDIWPNIHQNVHYPLSFSVFDLSGSGEILIKFLQHERVARGKWPPGKHGLFSLVFSIVIVSCEMLFYLYSYVYM